MSCLDAGMLRIAGLVVPGLALAAVIFTAPSSAHAAPPLGSDGFPLPPPWASAPPLPPPPGACPNAPGCVLPPPAVVAPPPVPETFVAPPDTPRAEVTGKIGPVYWPVSAPTPGWDAGWPAAASKKAPY